MLGREIRKPTIGAPEPPRACNAIDEPASEVGELCVDSRTILGVRLPRLSPRAYRRITLVALLAQVFITVSGAAVRLTGSGLGCSDWPTCEENQLVAPFEYHAMIEFINRTVTGFVSIAVILAVLGSLLRTPRRRDLTWLSLGLVGGVIGQIILGGLTVLFELHPPFVIAHFLVSMVLIWNAYVLHERSRFAEAPALPVVPKNVRILGRILVIVAAVTIFTGTIVTGTGPHGGDENVERLSFDITAVARVHSTAVWIFLALTIVILVVPSVTCSTSTTFRPHSCSFMSSAARWCGLRCCRLISRSSHDPSRSISAVRSSPTHDRTVRIGCRSGRDRRTNDRYDIVGRSSVDRSRLE